jgi:hypothetical protein
VVHKIVTGLAGGLDSDLQCLSCRYLSTIHLVIHVG